MNAIPQAKAEITALLAASADGDTAARERLYQLVYERVRQIAHREADRHAQLAMEPTELAHEAILRLIGKPSREWQSRAHFFAVVAQAVKQILIDASRRRMTEKRGGDLVRTTLSNADGAPALDDTQLLELTDAIEQLRGHDARKAEVVELTYFGGLTQREIALAYALDEATVYRDLRYAAAWLKASMGGVRR
jgi:RNA polymerase sigma factor (TIGR02999 family)